MDYSRHVINNFNKRYPFWKKALANITVWIASTLIGRSKNLLTKNDLKIAHKNLQKGDILLVGSLRRISRYIIKGPVTHALIYIGWNTFIHAVVDGVEKVNIKDVFAEFDTAIVLRHKRPSKQKIKKAIKYAKSQIGKPYDFEFNYKYNPSRFYCTELIYCTLRHAGIKTKLFKENRKKDLSILKPTHFLEGNFNVICHSHNIKIKDKKAEFIKGKKAKSIKATEQSKSTIYKDWIIKKFPKSYNFWQKAKANFSYLIGRIVVRKGANRLTKKDFENTKKKVQIGDIVLTGGFRRIVNFMVGRPLNHASLYTGKNKLVHSIGVSGVAEITLEDLLYEYDTLMILRHKKRNKKKIQKTVAYAKKQIGKSFDFKFEKGDKNLYCSELVFLAFEKAGFKIKVHERKRYVNIGAKLKNMRAVHPQDFIGGNFEIVFMSHNLRVKDGVVVLLNEKEVKEEKRAKLLAAKTRLQKKVQKGLEKMKKVEKQIEKSGKKTLKTLKKFLKIS